MKLYTSLKHILVINFIVAALLPLAVVGFLALQMLTANMEQEITGKNLLLAESLASEVERFLDEPLSLLLHLEEIIDRSSLIGETDINAYLAAILRNFTIFDTIMLLNETGRVQRLAPYNEDLMFADMSGQDFFRPEKQGVREPYWSPTFLSIQTGQPTLTLSLPLKKGSLVGYLNLATLNSIIKKIRIGDNGYAMIIDATGILIAHPNMDLVSQRLNISNLAAIRQGLFEEENTFRYWSDGVETLESVVMIPQTNWLVGVAQPADEAFASVRYIQQMIGLGIAIAGVFAIAIALFSLKKALYPLSQFTSHTQQIAQGDYHLIFDREHYQEIAELAHHFNMMIDAVKTRENALQKNEERLRSVLQNMPVMMNAADENSLFCVWNAECERVTGYTAEEIIGNPDALTLLYPDTPYLQSIMEKWAQRGNNFSNWEMQLRSSDGTVKTVAWSNISEHFPISGWNFWAVGIDVTERKHAEARIRKLNAELEQRVKQRTAELEVVNSDLRHVIYAASHDLKTPLRGINRLTHWLVKDHAEAFDAEARHMVELLLNRVQRMDALLDGILTYINIGRLPGQLHRIDLGLLLDEVIEGLTPPKYIHIKIVPPPPMILGHPAYIFQVFRHLLSNAITFIDKPEGYITIRWVEEETQWIFSVADNGPGIEERYYEKIFQIFQMLHSHDEIESTGIGLAVVKKIVELHRGKIWLESAVGNGSTFFFTLPKAHNAV